MCGLASEVKSEGTPSFQAAQRASSSLGCQQSRDPGPHRTPLTTHTPVGLRHRLAGTRAALPTSPAASRICTTSVLPNKAASCKALPISVWKANESAAVCHMTDGTWIRRDSR